MLRRRLAVVTLVVPPLRERREEVPPLARAFLSASGSDLARRVEGISEAAMAALVAHEWPGNVRELANAIERAVLLADGEEIEVEDLPARVAAGSAARAGTSGSAAGVDAFAHHLGPDGPQRSLAEVRQQIVADLERAYLRRLLASTDGRLAPAAERAGIDQRSLYNKMRLYGLRKEDFQPPSPRSPNSSK